MADRLESLAAKMGHAKPDDSSCEINRVHEQYLVLQQHFGEKDADNSETFTPYEKCLHKLVEILKWKGSERQLMEALPHLESITDILGLQAVLVRIGYQSIRKKVTTLRYNTNIYPCLLDFDDGPVIITGKLSHDLFKGIGGEGDVELSYSQVLRAKELVLVQANDDERGAERAAAKKSWFFEKLRALKKPIVATLLLTCAANVLALATPIYTMNVYNRVIGSQALDTLAYFFAAIAVVIVAEVFIRRVRGKTLAFIGARMDAEISGKTLKQVLTLPLLMTETASVNKQIVQFRQFESVRDLLTGNLASTLLDLPFIVIFFAVIAALAGWLALIPLTLLVIFGVLAIFTLPTVRRRSQRSGLDRAHFNRMSMELANKMQSIRELGVEELWSTRHSRVAQVSAYSMFHSRFFETSMQTVAQILVLCAGLATISIGAYQVIEGELNTGALIAIMMVVWRILTPIQIAFLSLNRIGQLKQTVKQLDRLMTLSGERRVIGRPNSLRKFEGAVKFEGVSFRYGPKSEPALKGINFEIKHGEIVAISGSTGAGKSTILKMMIGLYQPQAGRIFLDGVNVHQLDVGEVRSSIGYMPQEMSIFYGSLAQNMLLAKPTASKEDIYRVLHDAGVEPDDPILKDGLDRRIRNELGGLSESELARITLARAYLSEGPFLLLDNPGNYLDHVADEQFITQLKKFKGKKTVILVTNRPSHIMACDRLLQMHAGVLVNDMPVEAYIEEQRRARMEG